MKTFIKRVVSLLSWSAVGLGILSVVTLIVFATFGAKFVTVLSESMTASGIPVGAGVVVVPISASEIEAGDVILATSLYGDQVLHEAQGSPAKDENGRDQLNLKGTSNNSHEAYLYDVSDGAHRAIWSAPGLGSVVQLPWKPIPLTQNLIPGGAGVPWAALAAPLLVIWFFWPDRKRPAQKVGESAHELEASAN
ncbi:MAG: hypothetical protein WED09_05455 [Homoserinimonas sp.]